jgi:hypothetical protein
MSTVQTLRVFSEPVQVVAYSSITGSFVSTGIAMKDPIRILKVNNTTDADVYISFDGTTNNDVIVAGSGMVVDLTANKGIESGIYLPIGTIFYLKYVSGAPTLGNVYISAYYTVKTLLNP